MEDQQQREQRARALIRRGDRGEVTVTTVMMPVIVVAVMFVVQVGLAYYARQVVSGATQDGAATGALYGSTPAQGEATAQNLIAEGTGHLTTGSATSVSVAGDVVTVRASASVVKVFPLFPTFTVRAESSATIERFRPQGISP